MSLPMEKRKTVTLIGHNGSGKSVLAEAFLVKTGKAEKIGGDYELRPT